MDNGEKYFLHFFWKGLSSGYPSDPLNGLKISQGIDKLVDEGTPELLGASFTPETPFDLAFVRSFWCKCTQAKTRQHRQGDL